MSDNKKYYYLKLKDDFFERPEIKVLESMQNGYKYSNLLLKLYLKSLRFEGALRLNEYIPYNTEMISAIVGMDVDTVKVAFDIFKQLKLIEIMDSGTIYMLDIQNFIGKSKTEGDRKRAYRNKIAAEKNNQLLPEGQSVGQMSGQISDNPPPEIEKEIEKEIEIEKDKKKDKNKEINKLCKDVIEYLNEKAGTRYKYNSDKTKDLIKARTNEGYEYYDFTTVIDIKCAEWLNTDMSKYLRPITLFSNKFESYLNQGTPNNRSKSIEKKNNSSSLNANSNYNYDINSLIEKMKSEV
jgi:uncharacterized phage protein (TIGR02220 family)/predicted phage replisome organizer